MHFFLKNVGHMNGFLYLRALIAEIKKIITIKTLKSNGNITKD